MSHAQSRSAEAALPRLRVLVIGNSNSVMVVSFARRLAERRGIEVTNRSIGGSPNVVLLDALARDPEMDFDVVIVETAVVDAIQGAHLYSEARATETLELFIRSVRARSRAEIVILTIPTRLGFVSALATWPERLYREVAQRHGVALLDGFELVRQLVGADRIERATAAARRAEQMLAAFDLPRHLATSMAWRTLRNRHVPSSALGALGFVDDAHLSAALHALIGDILAAYLRRINVLRRHAPADPGMAPVVVAIPPEGGSAVPRRSSLMSRDMVQIAGNERAVYHCPHGFSARAIMVNRSTTRCILRLGSPAGAVTFGMEHLAQHTDWVGIVVAILDPLGDGDVTAKLVDGRTDGEPFYQLHETGRDRDVRVAELGEMIAVAEDWAERLPPPPAAACESVALLDLPESRALIAEAVGAVSRLMQGLDEDQVLVPAPCQRHAGKILARTDAPVAPADQARLMLLMGMDDALPHFLEQACAAHPDDEALKRMRRVIVEAG